MKNCSDLEIFNSLFTDYRNGFILFANSYVRDMAIAEDFVNDSMIYYWENRFSISSDSNLPAYILTTIKHKCLNYLQHLQTHTDVTEKLRAHAQWELSTRISTLEACDPQELFAEEIQSIVHETLRKLPQKTREIFLMSKELNFSYKEIAEQQGMTVKGVEFHMSNAMKALKKRSGIIFPYY
ncbi:DNA-directed RNA polymerase sigma-70 factor [Bacteroidia bacterium]|nr:DNA-directed RNA polymerase sigma-70 factor [Bacteroidia bacterium]